MDSKLILHQLKLPSSCWFNNQPETPPSILSNELPKTLTTISDFTFTFYLTLFARPLNLGTAFETYSVTTSALNPWTSRGGEQIGLMIDGRKDFSYIKIRDRLLASRTGDLRLLLFSSSPLRP